MMDLKDFFRKILNSSSKSSIPEVVLETFENEFDLPVNVEWSKIGGNYEAVFYIEDIEHIACYSSAGVRSALKINVPLSQVPENILNEAKQHGELMNAIAIHKNEKIDYELIVRDEELIRYTLMINSHGEVSGKEKL